jgi:heme/copper-type cytochrome/quinol oxidase subunit 2
MTRLRSKSTLAASYAAGVLLAAALAPISPISAVEQVREFNVSADQFSFSPGRIDVQQGDLVKITFTARDIAHSFTIDDYRIAKRAAAGQQIVIEFRADHAGTFTFYCNLTQDDRCRPMKGQLVVK